jgi:hypothetical protein
MEAASRTNSIGSNQSFVSTMYSLAALLGSDLRTVDICLETLPDMKILLRAIASTESRDPRDPTSRATHMLNLCFSSCREASTATLLGWTAMDSIFMKLMQSGTIPRFCTNPDLALLLQHAKNSPRECFDSLISSLDFGQGDTKCVMRSKLSSFLALCDSNAVQCEEKMFSFSAAELNSCDSIVQFNDVCSTECLALVQKLSSVNKCFESHRSISEAFAHFAIANCADSGKQD